MQAVMNQDKSADLVRELSSTLVSPSAILLALIWGLLNLGSDAEIEMVTIRAGTVAFLVAIAFGLMTVQYMITVYRSSEEKDASVAADARIYLTFFIGWFSFLAGCIFVGLSVFLSDF